MFHRTRRTARLSSLLAGVFGLLASACGEETTAPSKPEPVLAAVAGGPLVFKQVSPGGHHTCGVTVDNLAYCWGEGVTGGTRPVAVAGGLKFLGVNAGNGFTCGIATDRLAYCWGFNSVGQLGDGTTTFRPTPVPVAGGRKFRQLRAGYFHTCGVTTSDVAFCWGYNDNGQLGDGTTTTRLTPVRVAGGLRFSQARAGGKHSCGWTTGGKAYCWGANDEGQLGDGTTTRRLSPVAVAGGLTFGQLSPGGAHTCGATTAAVAYCWGRNSSGELGDGTTTRRLRPRLVAADGRRFEATATGVFHSCAVTPSGRAFCWGANDQGQTGTGGPQGSLSPKSVAGGFQWDGIGVGAIGSHGCGVTADGAAYCWGKNDSWQIGDGTSEDRRVPTAVIAPS